MAYITPNTTVYIMHNIPLDGSYQHTIYFASETAQQNYFFSPSNDKIAHTINPQSYQRVHSNRIRVEIPVDSLHDCNYLAFQNTPFNRTKWFYAFITAVEYINNAVSEVEYEIDVMQTWLPSVDYSLGSCFVEREHSSTDVIGDNLVPENLEIGELITNSYSDFPLSTMYVCAMTTKTSEGEKPTGRTINGIYTPLNIIAGIPATDASSLNELLDEFIGEGQEDAIVSLYQYPAFCGDASTTTPNTALANVTFPQTINGYNGIIYTDGTYSGIRNNKLLTYPYCCLVVSNNQGQTAEFRWENFTLNNGSAQFTVVGVFQGTPCVMCYPRNHKGIIQDYDSGLTISSFPMCPFAGDAYQAWMAQNRSSITTSIVGSAVTGVGVATALGTSAKLLSAIGGLYPPAAIAAGAGMAVAGALTGAYNDVLGVVGKTEDLKNTPPQVHGQTSCDSLNVGIGRVGFTFKALQIKPEFARIIDDFFSMFGYATNKLKAPNLHSREQWNYVKLTTVEFLNGNNIATDYIEKVISIYKNGITFWHNPSNIGNYALRNNPI